MRVAIVTPTIGDDNLIECLESIKNQDYDDFIHYIFIDGLEYKNKVLDIIFSSGISKYETVILSDNIGGNGWYGHRVYAASSFLVNADIICYLDQDNFVDSNHISSLVDIIKSGSDWAYSLRKIYSRDGKYLLNDDCESLGKWPLFFNYNEYHIDTNCFAIKRDIAVQVGHSWYAKWGADRVFFNTLRKYFPKFDCTGLYTLNYRLGGNDGSVKETFFQTGNKINLERYKEPLPWRKTWKN